MAREHYRQRRAACPPTSAAGHPKRVLIEARILWQKELGVVLLRFDRRNHNGYGRADADPAFDL